MRYEHRVTYRRTGWRHEQQRVFQTRGWTDRFVGKLRGWGRPDLSPIEFITVEKRTVGGWEKT